MYFHSGRCPASTSCRICLASWWFRCSLLTVMWSQLLAALAEMACTLRLSARRSIFWHGLLESSSVLVCLRPWRCKIVILETMSHAGCLSFHILETQELGSSRWADGTLRRRGIYGDVPLSSKYSVTPSE